MQQSATKAKILGGGAMLAKIKRMAYEVYENNFGATEIYLVGIGPRGLAIAKLLEGYLTEISPIQVKLVPLDKKAEGAGVNWVNDMDAKQLTNAHVVIVDDVLYSGHTLFQAVAAVMAVKPNKVEVAVLIDRGHRAVPVAANYVGMVLATSFLQYVTVEFEEDLKKASVYLY